MTAAAMTYDSLLADIQTYSERRDEPFVSQLPRFVMMAENRIATECRGLGFKRFVSGILGSSVVEKPARWRETLSINVTVGTERQTLRERGYEYCREFAPDASVVGVPRYYADYGFEHWLIVPTPDQNYVCEISFHERPEPLSSTNQTSWTTQYAPQLLLYATLLEAAPFLKRPDLLQQWQGMYEAAKNALAGESGRRMQDNNATRSVE